MPAGGGMQRFLPFLPDGEAAGVGGEALAIIAEDLEWLLSVDAAELWAVARSDASLALLIASFLQYAKRPYDEGFQRQSATLLAVWQRMLPLLHRIVCGDERGAPSKADRASVLASLLDFPRLLDICALYGPSAAAAAGSGSTKDSPSSQLSQLVAGAMVLLPRMASQAVQAGPLVAKNLGQVAEACMAAAGKAGREPDMMQSLQDGVAYLRDTCLTLASFIQAYPPAAALLLHQGPDLMEALGVVHDQLLPAVHRVARTAGTAGGSSTGGCTSQTMLLMLRQSCHVELVSERLAQLLLLYAYVQPPADAGGGSSGAGSSSAGSSSGSTVARGETLLHALMLLGHREEESGAGGPSGGGTGSMSLGQALAQRLGLGGSVFAALRTGSLSLDDAQADYVAALLGLRSLEEAPGPPLPGGSSSAADKAAARLAPDSGGGSQQAGMDLSLLKSKIQQVKDLLPDFGDGFVASCLQQLGNSPERVLNALLEGTLPAQLSTLDPQLSLAQWQAAAPTAAPSDGKGKGRVGEAEEPPSYDEAFPATLPGSSVGGWAAAGLAAAVAAAGDAGGKGRAAPAENKTARYLDVREETYRERLVAAANATQYEYDDEYDDSFDDLIAYGADGVTEIEGEDRGAARGGGGGAQRGQRAPALQPSAASFQPGGRPAAPGRQQQQQQGQGQGQQGQAQGGRGPKGKGNRLWVMEGRIYNYPKPGAQEVGSQMEADAALAAAEQTAHQILGLGPGGNKPYRPPPPQHPAGDGGSGGADAGAGAGSSGGQGGGDIGGGLGRGRGGRGGAGGRGDNRFKDAHKAAIGNHHRKDRAAAKQGRGMW